MLAGRQGPDVQVVDVHDAGDALDQPLDVGQVDVGRGRLEKDEGGRPDEADGCDHDDGGDEEGDVRVPVRVAREADEQGACDDADGGHGVPDDVEVRTARVDVVLGVTVEEPSGDEVDREADDR